MTEMRLNIDLVMGGEAGRRHICSSNVVRFITKLLPLSHDITLVTNIHTYRDEFMNQQCINFIYIICVGHSFSTNFERVPSSGNPFPLLVKYELNYLQIQLNLFETSISFLNTIF
jgi:hypothetical protein